MWLVGKRDCIPSSQPICGAQPKFLAQSALINQSKINNKSHITLKRRASHQVLWLHTVGSAGVK